MSHQFSLSGVEGILRELQQTGQQVTKNSARAMFRVGALVKDTAQQYAPISPSAGQLRSASTGTKAQRAAGKKRRKASATSRVKPGSLQASLRFQSDAGKADIYVPSNSPAGKYAEKMHNEKGKTWHRRGIGTQAKGAQADHKFIERAIRDNESKIDAILNDELGRGLPG